MPYLTAEPSADVLGNTDWHRHISADDVDGLAGSSHRLWRAANDARGKGDDPEANVLNVVGAATSLMLTDGAKPVFQPLMNLVDRGRSPALEDFGPYDVVALAAFATTAPTAALRARLADVAATAGYELGVKEWKSGILAAHATLNSPKAIC